MIVLQEVLDLSMLPLHHDFKRIYLRSLYNHLFTVCRQKTNLLLMKSESLMSLFCLKKSRTFDLTTCGCLLPAVSFAVFFDTLQALYLFMLPISLCPIVFFLFFCTQFSMSTLVVMSELVKHILCIKHSFKHLSTRYYEASFFEVLHYRYPVSGAKSKQTKTSYFCVQDFSTLSPKTYNWKGWDGIIRLLKMRELLLVPQSLEFDLTENMAHRGKAKTAWVKCDSPATTGHCRIICQ